MMYWILRGFGQLIGRLSPRSVERLAAALAFLVFDVTRLRRRLILRNIKIAFPEKTEAERIAIGRASVKHFGITALEFFRSARTDIAAKIEIKGAEHIRAALAKGQGAYVLCFHLGNWEAMGAAVSRHVAPAYVLVKKVGGDSVNRFVSELRDKNGFLIVRREKKGDGYKGIRDILARGEIVGFVMDQARPGEPKLPFFGHPAKTNTSFAAIWRRIPAPIVPGFIIRSGACEHTVEFLPEVQPVLTDDREADTLRHSADFNGIVEQVVRRCPEQYFWMHNRWK